MTPNHDDGMSDLDHEEDQILETLQQSIVGARNPSDRQEALLEAVRARVHLAVRRIQRIALVAQRVESELRLVSARIPDNLSSTLNTLQTEIERISDELQGLEEKIERTKDAIALFPVVKLIVFALVGMICMTVFGAMLAMVITRTRG